MSFTQRDDLFVYWRISGPKHNILMIGFYKDGQHGPVTLTPESLPHCCGAELDAEQIRAHVLAGVAEANQALGTHFEPRLIEYVSSDTRPESEYRRFAIAIMHHFQEQIAAWCRSSSTVSET